MGPLFESDSHKRRGGQNGAIIRVTSQAIIGSQACSSWADMAPTRKPEVGDLNRCILYLTQDWNGLGRDCYSSWTRINAGGLKCSQIFESFPGALLKSGVGPLARYGNHQETINRRPEQMCTSSDARLE